MSGRRAATSSRPGDVAPASASRTASSSSSCSSNASTATIGGRSVPGGELAEERQEQILVRRVDAAHGERPGRRRPARGSRGPSRGPRAASALRPPRTAPRSPRAPPAAARGRRRPLPSLTIPAFSVATSASVAPSSGWSSPIGTQHRDVAGDEVRRVPRPSHPDLEDRRDPTGLSANHRNASAVSASKYVTRPTRSSTRARGTAADARTPRRTPSRRSARRRAASRSRHRFAGAAT